MLSAIRSLGSAGFLFRSKRLDTAAAVFLVAATVIWSALAGKDLSWDQLNYHFYVGFAFLNERITHDFMAASGQSYLNPLAYVPFSWMVAHDWHSLTIASTLAASHALNIVFAYLITRTILSGPTAKNSAVALLGASLAFLSPIFLMEVGTTFSDITTSIFVIAAVLVVLRSEGPQRWWSNPLLLGGFAFGVGCALKPSNLVFAPAFAVLLLWMQPAPKRSVIAGIAFGVGAFAGIVAAQGAWSWQLLHAFGDPSSPTLDMLLNSPDVPPSTVARPQRFLPNDWLEGALLPFRMMAIRSWLYVETVAPDIRFAATMVLLFVAATLWLPRRKRREATDPMLLDSHKAAAFMAFFFTALVSWIATSANGRYGIVVSILCGPTLAISACLVWRRHATIFAVLAAITVAQFLHLQNLKPRWSVGSWTQSWYEASVPERLVREPYLYYSVGGNSGSYLVYFLNHESAFANPIGQVSFGDESSGARRLHALQQKFKGRIRVIAPIAVPDHPHSVARWTRNTDDTVARLGFAVDSSDCMTITTDGPPWRLHTASEIEAGGFHNHMRTCMLVERPYQHAAERQRMADVVRKIEAWCPRLFKSNGVIDGTPSGWSASYVATDTTLSISEGLITLSQPRSTADIRLGTVDDWNAGKHPDCEAIPTRFRELYNFD